MFMPDTVPEKILKQVLNHVNSSPYISVALNDKLIYIAINSIACSYLHLENKDIIGQAALEKYPEVIASKNHRNILTALSGATIENELIESRMGDTLITSYKPYLYKNKVVAVVIEGKKSRMKSD